MKKLNEFKDKKDFFKYLIANKRELIEFKKAALKFTDSFIVTDVIANKALSTDFKDEPATGMIKRMIVGNTYNWMDSHDDVHLDGVFTKTITENQKNIWHLHDHEQKITAKVGKPISVYEKSVPWTDLGVTVQGNTTCLMMDSNIMKDYNSMVFDMYLNKEINQHSVGMRYGIIDLAINDPLEKAEFAVWTKHFNSIGNKNKVAEQGYFWAVKEAKLIEISAVLAGSNELTPTVENDSSKTIVDNPKQKKKEPSVWDVYLTH